MNSKIKGEKMSKSAIKSVARNNCANFSNDRCLGVMLRTEKYKSSPNVIRTRLYQWVDKEKANGKCTIDKGCDYFNYIVAPGL
jgi:hypothetical protein